MENLRKLMKQDFFRKNSGIQLLESFLYKNEDAQNVSVVAGCLLIKQTKLKFAGDNVILPITLVFSQNQTIYPQIPKTLCNILSVIFSVFESV